MSIVSVVITLIAKGAIPPTLLQVLQVMLDRFLRRRQWHLMTTALLGRSYDLSNICWLEISRLSRVLRGVVIGGQLPRCVQTARIARLIALMRLELFLTPIQTVLLLVFAAGGASAQFLRRWPPALLIHYRSVLQMLLRLLRSLLRLLLARLLWHYVPVVLERARFCS